MVSPYADNYNQNVRNVRGVRIFLRYRRVASVFISEIYRVAFLLWSARMDITAGKTIGASKWKGELREYLTLYIKLAKRRNCDNETPPRTPCFKRGIIQFQGYIEK